MKHLLREEVQATTLSSIMGVSTILPNFDFALWHTHPLALVGMKLNLGAH